MRYLLDTHAFLWFVSGNQSLSLVATSLIEDRNSDIFLSAASIWEMAIKISLGKLSLPSPYSQFIDGELDRNGIILLSISTEHADKVARLPYILSGHKDPFDRLIVAQSLCENLPVVTKDKNFNAYGVDCHW